MATDVLYVVSGRELGLAFRMARLVYDGITICFLVLRLVTVSVVSPGVSLILQSYLSEGNTSL